MLTLEYHRDSALKTALTLGMNFLSLSADASDLEFTLAHLKPQFKMFKVTHPVNEELSKQGQNGNGGNGNKLVFLATN